MLQLAFHEDRLLIHSRVRDVTADSWRFRRNQNVLIRSGDTTMTKQNQDKRESGLPGGGRKDEVGGSGVCPMSGPLPPWRCAHRGSKGGGVEASAGRPDFEDHGDSQMMAQQAIPERCRDIMTKDPVCCLPTDTAEKAADRRTA
jgi:hypothetical protein